METKSEREKKKKTLDEVKTDRASHNNTHSVEKPLISRCEGQGESMPSGTTDERRAAADFSSTSTLHLHNASFLLKNQTFLLSPPNLTNGHLKTDNCSLQRRR